jgi:hypothetical protein
VEAGRVRELLSFAVGWLALASLLAVYTIVRGSLVLAISFGPLLIPFSVLTLVGFGRRRRARVRVQVDDAWLQAAGRLAQSRGGALTARQLAEATHIAVPDAERILTRLSVDRGSVDIDADQQLHYRVDVSEPLDSEPPQAHDESSRHT